MKLICDRAVLAAAVQLAQQVVATRAAVPALSCIKLTAKDGRLTLQAADKDIAVEVPVAAVEVKEAGEALVPAKKLAEVVNECEGATISFEVSKHALTIKADRMKFSILGFDPKEFPSTKDAAVKADFVVPADTLRRLVVRSVFAAATENTRFAMGGVYMERKAPAPGGHRWSPPGGDQGRLHHRQRGRHHRDRAHQGHEPAQPPRLAAR